jgi:hypothetical protein
LYARYIDASLQTTICLSTKHNWNAFVSTLKNLLCLILFYRNTILSSCIEYAGFHERLTSKAFSTQKHFIHVLTSMIFFGHKLHVHVRVIHKTTFAGVSICELISSNFVAYNSLRKQVTVRKPLSSLPKELKDTVLVYMRSYFFKRTNI